jgi:hypothetical protein
MANTKNVGDNLKTKGQEIKKWLMDLDAKLEKWKFSVEDTQEGMRVEIHAVALIKHPKEKSNVSK